MASRACRNGADGKGNAFPSVLLEMLESFAILIPQLIGGGEGRGGHAHDQHGEYMY